MRLSLTLEATILPFEITEELLRCALAICSGRV